MDDLVKRIIDENRLVNEILGKGLKGYSVERVDRGYHYRFLLKDGSFRECLNLSKESQKKIKVYQGD